ncbi:MAG: hypothetical protein R6V58_17370, partial [Planctomycetota bacterium]
AGAAAVAVWRMSSKEPAVARHDRADLQREVGAEVARVTADLLASNPGPVAVLTMIPQRSGAYAEQLEAFKGVLAEEGVEAQVYDPRSVHLRGDDPYIDGFEPILEESGPAVLVGLVHGGLDVRQVGPALRKFIDTGGRLVLLGDIYKAEGTVQDWIRGGKAVVVARHAGALGHLAPRARTLDPGTTPQEYVDKYYTVLTSENIARHLRP